MLDYDSCYKDFFTFNFFFGHVCLVGVYTDESKKRSLFDGDKSTDPENP